jgi:hypothetical protein
MAVAEYNLGSIFPFTDVCAKSISVFLFVIQFYYFITQFLKKLLLTDFEMKGE